MLTLLAHDWRRFLLGGLLPAQWVLAGLLSAVWGSLLARLFADVAGPGGIDALWAGAPYDFAIAMIVPVFLVVNCGIRLGGDYAQGTEKYELLSGVDRSAALGAHALFLAGSSLVTYGVAAVGYLVVPLTSGRLGDASLAGAIRLVTATGAVWAGSLPFLALLILAGLVLRSLEGLIALGLVLLAASGSLNAILGASGWALPTVFMLRPAAALPTGRLLPALAIAVAVTAAAGFLSTRLWLRKDILR
nr:hypothetical protein [Propionibacterium sp.]